MGVFKILAGVTIGVGAVAAAPFTGGGSVLAAATLIGSLSGAAAIATATGAAVAGGAAGYILGNKEDKKQADTVVIAKEEGKRAGEALAKEEYAKIMKNLCERIKEYQNFENHLIGFFAVGLAVAHADGEVSFEEKQELEEFISGISASYLPESVQVQIKKLEETPPNFNVAMEYAKKYGCKAEDIRDIIQLIIMADGKEDSAETVFRKSFENYNYPQM